MSQSDQLMPVRLRLGGFREYIAIASHFIETGYRCATFDIYESSEQNILLRHDIDADLSSSLRLARLEAELGLQATYFVLLTSEFYNPMSAAGRRAIREISDCGHAVGLHIDVSVHGAAPFDEAGIDGECRILEQILGARVSVVAPHRPAALCPQWLGSVWQPRARLQAYHPRFFLPGSYISDSRGWWAYGHPHDLPAKKASQGVHLLTHPHLWASDEALDRDGRIAKALHRRDAELWLHAAEHFTGFAGTNSASAKQL